MGNIDQLPQVKIIKLKIVILAAYREEILRGTLVDLLNSRGDLSLRQHALVEQMWQKIITSLKKHFPFVKPFLNVF